MIFALFFSLLSIKLTKLPNNRDRTIKIHTCEHDKFISKLKKFSPQKSPKNVKYSPKSLDSPIRVVFDFDCLTNGQDSRVCTTSGTEITWGGETHQCTVDDIVTEEKKNVVIQTFTNVQNFLSRLLKVSPSSPFNPSAIFYHNEYPVMNRTIEADLFLTVYARPFGVTSSTLASAGAVAYDANNNNRPMIGIVHVNMRKVPEYSSNFDTQSDRAFFETVLHEVCHALGFSENLYHSFINRETNQPYGQDNLPLKFCSNSSYPDVEFRVLSTPKLHEIAVARYGSENFFENCPAGIIIEQGGGEGTAGSHFDQLIYYNELMVGTQLGVRTQISELSLGLLYDTGWYDVNFSFSEPLYYGDYRYVIGRDQPYYNFSTAPPQLVFPKNYLFNESESIEGIKCLFDHSAAGSQRGTPQQYNCATTPNSVFCKSLDYYDPYRTGNITYDSQLFDYQSVVVPYSNMVCSKMKEPSENSGTFKSSYGPGTFCVDEITSEDNIYKITFAGECYKMTCDQQNSLSIWVEEESGICNSVGETVTINQITLRCPDPSVICGIINNGVEMPTQEPTHEPTQEPAHEPTQEPAYEPTQEPAYEPTQEPAHEPTQEPAHEPTQEEPTQEPTPTKTPPRANLTLNIRKVCVEGRPDCLTPSQIKSYSFADYTESINVYLNIFTELRNYQLFNFSTLPPSTNVYINGTSPEESAIFLNLSLFGTNINELKIDNVSLTFLTNPSAMLFCNSLELMNNVNLIEENKINAQHVKELIFANLTFFSSFESNDITNINIEDKTINSIEVTPGGIVIKSSKSQYSDARFSNTGTGDINISSNEETINVSIQMASRYINLFPQQSSSTIDASKTNSESRLGIFIESQSISVIIPEESNIDFIGHGSITLMASSVSASTSLKSNSFIVDSTMNIIVNNQINNIVTNLLHFTGRESQINLNTSPSNIQKLEDASVTFSISSVEVESGSESHINLNSEIIESINIKEGGQLIFSHNPTFGNSLSISHTYSTKAHQKSPIIQTPNIYSAGTVSRVSFTSVSDFSTSADEKLNSIQILQMSESNYNNVEFSDSSSNYYKTYENGYLAATLDPTNVPDNGGDEGNGGNNDKTTIIVVVVVVVVVVLIIIVVVVVCVRKKKKWYSDSSL